MALSNAAVLKLMEDCEAAGGEIREVGAQEFDFRSEYGAILRVKHGSGKGLSILLVGTPYGTVVSPPIKVTLTQARALSEL